MNQRPSSIPEATGLSRYALPVLAALALSLLSVPSAEARDSGITCGVGRFYGLVFVNKDVGDARYAITFNTMSSEVSGNVYEADGSVTLLACESTIGQDAWGEGSDPLRFTCWSRAGCDETSCSDAEDAGNSELPRSFFEAPCTPVASGPATNVWTNITGLLGGFDFQREVEICRNSAFEEDCSGWNFSFPGRNGDNLGDAVCAKANCAPPRQ